MTLTIEISPNLEERLKLAAQQAGLRPEDFARRLIETLPLGIVPSREYSTPGLMKTPLVEHETDLNGNSIRATAEHEIDFISPEFEPPTATSRRAAAIAFLKGKLSKDATDDPDEIRFSEEEFKELNCKLNSNRDATGERRVFV